MRVLHVGKYYYPYKGGIETLMKDVSESLVSHKTATTVLVFNDSNKTEIARINGVNVIRCSSLFKLFSQPISISYFVLFFRLYRRYEIIHVHLPNILSTILICLIKWKRNKLIIHWHSDIVKQKVLNTLLMPFQLLALRNSHAVIATSPNYYRGSYALRKFFEKIVVIPCCFNEYKNIGNQEEGNSHFRFDGKKVIFSLGRLVEYKGLVYLIRAAKFLPDNYLICIGGKGPLFDKLKSEIEINDVSSKVNLLGPLSEAEVTFLFKQSYIFVLPSISRAEAFGMVMIEAMFFSKPIIATNIENSGVNWVNEHGVSGLNVSPKNAEEIANAILAIGENKELHEEFSKQAFARAINMFTLEKTVIKIEELYKKVLDNDN
jgi:rhamnosyl/mannosyltransferase